MRLPKKCALIILDGWGHGPDPDRSAIAVADTPFVDTLYADYPNAELTTHGLSVGLPDGQMGNSEVGHLNIGAGRVVNQELARINSAIEDGSFYTNVELVALLNDAKKGNKKVHLMGLLSDGGVHSHINHLKALVRASEKQGLTNVYIHAFLDGRDTDPHSGKDYVKDILEFTQDKSASLTSIIGRYYAMDRDKRWERTQRAYNLLTRRVAHKSTTDAVATITELYQEGITDEFMYPLLCATDGEDKIQRIADGDVVIFFNFRTDRPRQLTEVLTQRDHPNQDMRKLDIDMATMTMYDKGFEAVSVLYSNENLKMTIGEVIQNQGLRQVRTAETEKYPHVTYFLSGGQEEPFKGEKRLLVSSPKVATYDLQPQMSARDIADGLMKHVSENAPDLVVVNFANTDMVGHTGIFDAAVMAAETVDGCLTDLVPLLSEKNYDMIIIADHGNADIMINPDGSPHTFHTLSPVPVIYVGEKSASIVDGVLADIAPTILHIMGIEVPKEMTGAALVKFEYRE